MKSLCVGPGRRQRVRIGAPDASLTGCAGVIAVSEMVEKLGLVEVIDACLPGFKQRDRGLSGGQFLIALSTAQLLGADCFSELDRQRADAAGQSLWPVLTPPATTAGALARRFGPAQLRGVEAALPVMASRWLAALAAPRRRELVLTSPTIDLDSTEVEVYGRSKAGTAYNYVGQRAGRPHLASWAEAGWPLAADLLTGNQDVLAGLPAAVCARPRVRADAGYFNAELAHAADDAGCDWAIAARRTGPFWRQLAAVEPDAWMKARDMPGAQIAAIDHAPPGWPADAYTIVRRVRVEAGDISADPRSRRRRAIAKDQLAFALDGELDHTWAVSFILTNIPADSDADVTAIEAWFRRRTDIEERFREAKLGAGLNHLPSGDATVNTVWMWAALLAGALSVMLQSLSRLDEHGHARHARLRYELLRVPARIIRHARGLTLRLPPGPQVLPAVLARLRALPPPA